ncbi:non-ribosomal peptide synthetase [Streptomyces platensis]|uniref:non-ribosomal peptide synthetase n=1 Tax=Streptomyces platensis TaxID=58346 RepID=UPI00331942A0
MLSITSQYLARFRRLDAGDGTPVLLPVTGAQRRFALVRAMDPHGRPDLVPMFFAFPRGTVDPVRLAAAANRLAARHPVLRARPTVLRGTPVLRLERPQVPVIQETCAPGEDAATVLRRALGRWAPEGAPLRLFLVPDGPEGTEEVLAVVLDHSACDGQSLARLVEELGAGYDEGPRAEGPSAADVAAELAAYQDAVLRQLDAEERAGAPEAMAYWGERLRTVCEQDPVARPEPLSPGAPPSGSAVLGIPAPAAGVPFPELLNACRAAAAVLYGAGHVVPLGYPWGGRPAGAAPVLGCFLNTVVFPTATGDATSASATAAAWWDDLDHAATPFDAVVHAARAAGSGWRGQLDGMLTVDDTRRQPPLRLGGVTGREIHVDGRAVRGPFAVSVSQGSELRLRMVWDRAVLPDHAAERAFTALADAVRTPVPTAG